MNRNQMIQLMENWEETMEFRLLAIQQITRFTLTAARPALLRLIHDSDPAMRIQAMNAHFRF